MSKLKKIKPSVKKNYLTNLDCKWQIKYTKQAVKEIESLSFIVQKRIANKMRFFAQCTDIFKYAKKLVHPELGTFRLRIGDYRVIFDIRRNKEIIILKIAKRDEVYK